jgi:hypothetical protein
MPVSIRNSGGGYNLPSAPISYVGGTARSAEPVQSALGGVFLGVVEVLSIVPVSCGKGLTQDCNLT